MKRHITMLGCRMTGNTVTAQKIIALIKEIQNPDAT